MADVGGYKGFNPYSMIYDPTGNMRGWAQLTGAGGFLPTKGVTFGAREQAPTAAPQTLDFGAVTGPASYIVGPESGGNANAKNPRSSAAGLGQFIESTWHDEDLKGRAGFAFMPPAVWDTLRSGERGAPAQVAMTNAYAARNAEQWQARFKRAPTPGQVYGMHFLDASGFIKLTETAATNPKAKAAELFPDAAKANPEIFKPGSTVADVYNTLIEKPKGVWDAPNMQKLDVEGLMGMIPNPPSSIGAPIDLPNAPQRPQLPARPQAEQIDVNALTAMFEKYAPPKFDETKAKRLEFMDVLAGMAQGAMGVDPNVQGFGALLLGIGAGAAGAKAKSSRMSEEQRMMMEEASRQFGLDLTKLRVQAEDTNRGVRNTNAQITWQDAYDELERQFQDKRDQWQVDVQETTTNIGRSDNLAMAQYGAASDRAKVGIGAIENNVGLENQETGQQAELDLKQYLYEAERNGGDQLITQATGLVQSIGIDPKIAAQTKDPIGLNAFAGAAAIATNNKPGAINALGKEMVLAGRLDLITDEKTRKEIEKLQREDPEAAALAVGQMLNEDEAASPGTVLQLARILAGAGSPTATLILRTAKPKAAEPAK